MFIQFRVSCKAYCRCIRIFKQKYSFCENFGKIQYKRKWNVGEIIQKVSWKKNTLHPKLLAGNHLSVQEQEIFGYITVFIYKYEYYVFIINNVYDEFSVTKVQLYVKPKNKMIKNLILCF